MKYEIFVTGGTGFIGQWLIRELTHKNKKVAVLMRKPEKQFQALSEWVQSHGGDPSLIFPVKGDLTQKCLGLSKADYESLSEIRIIYHLGAAFSWGLKYEKARHVNVLPIEELIRLAENSSHFLRFVNVSGFMMCNEKRNTQIGLNNAENWEPGQWKKFSKKHGVYETTKYEAHYLMKKRFKEKNLPYTIIHPAAVVGASDTGEIIAQYEGILALAEQLLKGIMFAVPGNKKDWLPIIPVDFLASFIAGIVDMENTDQKEFLLLDDRTPDLKTMVDKIGQILDVNVPDRRIPVGLLRFFLKTGMGKLLSVSHESLAYIDSERYDTQSMEDYAVKMGLSLPEPEKYLQNTISYMMTSGMLSKP